MVQSIKRVTFKDDIDLDLFNKIKKFTLKKRDSGEVKIYFPKEKYFKEGFDLIGNDNSIILSLYYDDEDSYKILVARLMDGFDELGMDYDWDAAYIPNVSIIFDESINSDDFYRIINKKRRDLGYCELLARMVELNSDNINFAVFKMICQIADFDKLLNQICVEIKDVNPNFEVIIS